MVQLAQFAVKTSWIKYILLLHILSFSILDDVVVTGQQRDVAHIKTEGEGQSAEEESNEHQNHSLRDHQEFKRHEGKVLVLNYLD